MHRVLSVRWLDPKKASPRAVLDNRLERLNELFPIWEKRLQEITDRLDTFPYKRLLLTDNYLLSLKGSVAREFKEVSGCLRQLQVGREKEVDDLLVQAKALVAEIDKLAGRVKGEIAKREPAISEKPVRPASEPDSPARQPLGRRFDGARARLGLFQRPLK